VGTGGTTSSGAEVRIWRGGLRAEIKWYLKVGLVGHMCMIVLSYLFYFLNKHHTGLLRVQNEAVSSHGFGNTPRTTRVRRTRCTLSSTWSTCAHTHFLLSPR